MESDERVSCFGERMREELVEPFEAARIALQARANPEDSAAAALLEVANAVRYQERTCSFYQEYRHVPDSQGRGAETVRFPMGWQDVEELTRSMAERTTGER